MAYVPTNWQEPPNLSTPITAARLNNMEAGIAAAVTTGTASITNADISPTAAIAYTKLNLALGILNADISASAAIAYSKLALTNSIVTGDIVNGTILDADINAAAAIAASKLSGYPSDATKSLRGDGTWSSGGAAQKVSTNPPYDLINTASEGSMISGASASATTGFLIPAGTMGATGAIRVTLIGDMVNNTGGAVNMTIKCKVANSAIYGNLTAVVASATRSPFQVQFVWANLGLTNANFMTGTLIRPMSAAFSSGSAGSVAGIHIYDDTHMVNVPFMSNGLNAVDMSVAQYVDITALWGSASLSASVRRMYASVEYL